MAQFPKKQQFTQTESAYQFGENLTNVSMIMLLGIKGKVMVFFTCINASGIEVCCCKVQGKGHHIQRNLRNKVYPF